MVAICNVECNAKPPDDPAILKAMIAACRRKMPRSRRHCGSTTSWSGPSACGIRPKVAEAGLRKVIGKKNRAARSSSWNWPLKRLAYWPWPRGDGSAIDEGSGRAWHRDGSLWRLPAADFRTVTTYCVSDMRHPAREPCLTVLTPHPCWWNFSSPSRNPCCAPEPRRRGDIAHIRVLCG